MSSPIPAHKEALEQFAQKLAGLLGPQFASAPTLAVSSAESEDQTADKDAVMAVLRFEGALAGECTVRISQAALSQAAGTDAADGRAWLESVLDRIAEPLAEALFARYGRTRVQRLGEDAPVSPASTPIAALHSDGATRVVLLADREFEEALERMGRAAAAAEASGFHQGNLGLVMDVELEVTLRFGQRQLALREVLELGSGSVVELESQVDEPVELILDGRVIARGEAVIVDGNYGIRITEVLHPVMAA